MAEQREQVQQAGAIQGQAGAEEAKGAEEVSGAEEGKGIEKMKERGGLLRQHRGRTGGFESSPFAMMRHFADEIDRAFSSMLGGRSPLAGMSPFELIASGGWVPALESYEEDGNIVLCADLPGLRPEDVKVEVIGDELVIAGERVQEKEETKGGFYSERQYGCFERRVALPEGCDPEKVEATFENGVLKVTLAAPEKQRKSRKVEVKGKPSQSEGGQQTKGEGEVH